MEKVREVTVSEGVLQKPDAILGHRVERRGSDRDRILAHLPGQVDQRDDHTEGAYELAHAAQILESELAEHWGLRPLLKDDRVPAPLCWRVPKDTDVVRCSPALPYVLEAPPAQYPGTCRGAKELGQQIAA